MAITSQTITHLGGSSYIYEWTSDSGDPTFYIYDLAAGVLVTTTKGTSYTVTIEPGESAVLEVRESAYATIPRGYPGRLTLFWYATADTDHYRAEEYSGGQWVLRARILDDGRGHCHWHTRWLEDVTTHQFRVIPVGDNGNEGTAKTWSVLMVRYPDVPDQDFSYDEGTDKVTVAA